MTTLNYGPPGRALPFFPPHPGLRSAGCAIIAYEQVPNMRTIYPGRRGGWFVQSPIQVQSEISRVRLDPGDLPQVPHPGERADCSFILSSRSRVNFLTCVSGSSYGEMMKLTMGIGASSAVV